MTEPSPTEPSPTAPSPPKPTQMPRPRQPWARQPWSRLGFVALVLAATSFGLYELTTRTGKHVAHAGSCAQSLDLATAADPLIHGEVAALTLASAPNSLDRISFDDSSGAKTTVSAFHGKTILLNLWATWCIPCRAEMPSLDKLQASLGSNGFAVVPVNIDTVRLDKARSFFHDIGATNLAYYADNSADILQDLRQSEKIVGLPTTILIGKDGCEIGTMAGPAQWDSPEARALIERLEQAPANAQGKTQARAS